MSLHTHLDTYVNPCGKKSRWLEVVNARIKFNLSYTEVYILNKQLLEY